MSPGFAANLTGYDIGIISKSVSVPFSECADICWHVINSSDIPTVPFDVSVAGRNEIGIGQPQLCAQNKVGKTLLRLIIICKS